MYSGYFCAEIDIPNIYADHADYPTGSYGIRPLWTHRNHLKLTSVSADEIGMNYLQDQLIAYIGNKRALLPFLSQVFQNLTSGMTPVRFYDPFAGAGAVSRLGKTLGFQVHSNDWEQYSYLINSCFIGVDAKTLPHLFTERGGLHNTISVLQQAGESGNPAAAYISRHYAPRRTATADYRKERLFYTRENAEFIDIVRTQIEDWYPGRQSDERRHAEKSILIASLLYEAATHSNTSGVFKAYHKGFGGHGGDALGRIMAPMQLEIPVLYSSPVDDHTVSCGDAAASGAHGSYDLTYLDPPYNCHQYGSNYFMLNTIARWDRPAVDSSIGRDGRLEKKAGIRPDWVETRSPYCSKAAAADALRALLDSVDSRYFVLSYNTDGIISFEEQLDIFAERGHVNYTATEYASYKGGRQSMTRRTATTEYLLTLDTRKKTRASDVQRIDRQRKIQYVRSLQSQRFVPGRLQSAINAAEIKMPGFHAELLEGFLPLQWVITEEDFCSNSIEMLTTTLERAMCIDQFELFGTAMTILETTVLDKKQQRKIENEAVKALKRFTHRKYEHQYQQAVTRILRLVELKPQLSRLAKTVAGIQHIAALRFAG